MIIRVIGMHLFVCVVIQLMPLVLPYCHSEICRQPECYCKSNTIPYGYSREETPQMIMLTFDDSINLSNFDLYNRLFADKINPNGCPVSGTFYVSHEGTDYWMVQSLYARGHEIAAHSITHRFPIDWWKNAWYDDWYEEMEGQRQMLEKWAFVNKHDIKGMRAPFLQVGGNTQFQVIYDLGMEGFQYDASLLSYNHLLHPYPPPIWPYTMDHPVTDECAIPPCPDWTLYGVWEIPIVQYTDLYGDECAMLDDCDMPTDSEYDAYRLLQENFERHYYTNRAPFGIYMHSVWLETEAHLRGLQTFIRDMVARGDVYFVTASQVIDWMKTPTKLAYINNFKPWSCNDKPRRWVCSEGASTTCHFDQDNNLMKPDQRGRRGSIPLFGETGHSRRDNLKNVTISDSRRDKRWIGSAHNMRTCAEHCPEHYPWIYNVHGW